MKDPICGMDVDESKGLSLVFSGKKYFFCSKHCLEKFSKENKIVSSACLNCNTPKLKFYKNKIFILTSLIVLLSGLSFIFPALVSFRQSLFSYLKIIWWAVLLGLFIGGVIDHYIPREYISHILSSPKKRTIIYSVFLGFFMSACSHGILALSMQLYKKGASTSSVIAFLLASPWANMALTIMLFAFFGIKALFIIFSAMLIAVITGFIFQYLEKKNIVETNKNSVKTSSDFSLVADIKNRLKNYRFSLSAVNQDIKGVWSGMVSLSNMVLWWILLGIIIASVIGAYVPVNIFHSYMKPNILGLLFTLLVATVIEVCSEGSSPIAFEIYRKTQALGNSFVFLMAGVVTDYTEIGLIWTNIGKKAAIWMVFVTVPQVIILGILFNMFL